ncbi:RNA-guided endonuclease InsQ/TnpB family protein [Spirosoma utsteinense]|uniref:RNA-guided endonuclease InsQ/TnpB family protein n=1 Tax=Spirosoma utsteinense TaxID=2585773 RepID=UPI001648C5BB|nr:RNA-guided endonuclease TnpB family protein [Spirosoma utsteinense]MBC3785732.1 IS605 OrfB family transposase [Spirosoma utsteinense]
MKLTAKIKLLPNPEQAQTLLATLMRANEACNFVSEGAWGTKQFKQFGLHKLVYYSTKERFELSAQVVVRCIAKVVDAYKLDKKVQRVFRPTGAIVYDSRILSFKPTKKTISIWTLGGRETIPYVGGQHHEDLLQYQKGEADLFYRKGSFYLLATCEIPDEETSEINGMLGIDMGIVNLATDSEGEVFSGAGVEVTRQWYQKRRAVLQSVSTRSAKRRLKKLSGKQAKFQANSNHCISKSIVLKAKAQGLAIAIEDLSGISMNVRKEKKRLRQTQRGKHSNWSYYQLRSFLEYKSVLYGVTLITIDPAYTSRTCSQCGHCEKANRKSQAEFKCKSCGHSALADENASQNIKKLGLRQVAYGAELSGSGASPLL